MLFADYKAITIPEGNVTKITANGVVLWEAVSGLPSAYQEVEWVQADANVGAYIKLGFAYDAAATIYMGQWVANDNTAYPFGAAENSGGTRCMFSIPYGTEAHAYFSTGGYSTSIKLGYVRNSFNGFVATYKAGEIRFKNITNGQEVTSTAIISYTMTSDLYLFAQNYNGSPRFGDIRRISYFQYYDKNDTLVCDLIPCYRKSDGVIGMYDMVRRLFLTNVGTGTFTKGADVVRDISKYQQVEWVQADHHIGAYINLGFSFDSAAVVKLKMYGFGTNEAYIFGAAESSGKYRCMISAPYNGTKTAYCYGSNGTTYLSTVANLSDGWNELVYTLKPGLLSMKNETNGSTNSDTSNADFTMISQMFLFAQNYNGSARYAYARRVASFQYYDKNGTLICDLIPCYRKSDGVIGMYDKARKMFLSNVGTGTFTKGADV